MAYDNLGTSTYLQLVERLSYLDRMIFSIQSKIESAEAQRMRLAGQIFTTDVDSGSRSFNISHTCEGVVYNYATSVIPKVAPQGSYIRDLQFHAQHAGYAQRVDPVSEDITQGDAPWRPFARIFQPGRTDDVDRIASDDTVVAHYVERIMRPFKDLGRRPEGLEEKAKKAKYKYMKLGDDIELWTRLLESWEDQKAELLGLADNEEAVTDSAGETINVSEYPTAAVDQKNPDILSEEDQEDLLNTIYPPAVPATTSVDAADPTTTVVHPAPPGVPQVVNLPANAEPGDLEALREAFPIIFAAHEKKHHDFPQYVQQMLANIHTYNFDVFEELPIEGNLKKSARSTRYRYVLPNVHTGLQALSAYVASTYGLVTIVTEAWPPTLMHAGVGGHVTGNSVDVVFDCCLTYREGWQTFVTNELVDAILTHAVEQGWCSGGLNEYKIKTAKSTGKHLHLDWRGKFAIYNNDYRLLNLGLSQADASSYKLK